MFVYNAYRTRHSTSPTTTGVAYNRKDIIADAKNVLKGSTNIRYVEVWAKRGKKKNFLTACSKDAAGRVTCKRFGAKLHRSRRQRS